MRQIKRKITDSDIDLNKTISQCKIAESTSKQLQAMQNEVQVNAVKNKTRKYNNNDIVENKEKLN